MYFMSGREFVCYSMTIMIVEIDCIFVHYLLFAIIHNRRNDEFEI